MKTVMGKCRCDLDRSLPLRVNDELAGTIGEVLQVFMSLGAKDPNIQRLQRKMVEVVPPGVDLLTMKCHRCKEVIHIPPQALGLL